MIKREKFNIFVIIIVSFVLLVVDLGRTFAYFVGPNGEIITSTLNGMTTLDKDYIINKIPITNTESNQNAVLATSGNSRINESVVTKTGDGSSEALDGGNSAILVQSNASLSIMSASITTDGAYADAVYASGGRVTVAGGSILTKARNSNGIVVSNNGSAIANYLDLETLGDNSSAIYNLSGSVTVNGGSYKTNGAYSPIVKAYGDVSVDRNSNFVSEKSEGFIVDGEAIINFNNSRLETNNTVLSDGISVGKSVLLYQSSVKNNNTVPIFNASGSNIITHKGATFYVTNTRAIIMLLNNTIVNDDGVFMRVEAASFGTSGSNGGDVFVDMSNQSVTGNVYVDSISKLEMNLNDSSSFQGAINPDNKGEEVNLNLSSNSILSLTGDTYLSSLNNEDTSNSNIRLNGHNLYIDGKKFGSGGSGTGGSGSSGSGQGNGSGTGDNHSGSGTESNVGNDKPSGEGTNNAGNGTNTNGTGGNNNTGTGDNSNTGNNNKNSNAKDNKTNNGNVDTNKNSATGDTANNGKSSNSSSSTGTSKNVISSSVDDVIYDSFEVKKEDKSAYIIDDKTLIIINVVGILLIVTSTISLIRIRALKKLNENS